MTNTTPNLSIYDLTIRMLLLFMIIGWCLMLMIPFVHIVLWGVILTLAFDPLHRKFTRLLRGRSKLAAVLIVVLSLSVLILPGILFLNSIIDGVKILKENYLAGNLTIPPPSEKVKSWPVIGNALYDLWQSGSSDIEHFILKYQSHLVEVGSKIGKGLLSAAGGIVQMLGAVFIAGFLLMIGGTNEVLRKFFNKVAGNRGDEFTVVVNQTIQNVVKGILGVALIQALLTGAGFMLAGIPMAGLWTLLVFILAALQLPPAVIVLPVIAYMFSEKETMTAVLWTCYLMIAGISDNVLKPILLGKGAPVPMLVIFIGVIGGFIFSGFIGMFTGAVVMSLGYKLFVSWLEPEIIEAEVKAEEKKP
jgi:predicted PurR-regulated permease PerM